MSWWSAADDDVLVVACWFDVKKATTWARRTNNKLSVAIHRPVQTFAAADDPVSLARLDVNAMLATVRRRTGLGPPPTLPNLRELAAQTTQAIAHEDERLDRMRSLLSALADRLPAGLVTELTTELNDGLTGDFLEVLRIQLLHLAVSTTEQESAELDALTHDG